MMPVEIAFLLGFGMGATAMLIMWVWFIGKFMEKWEVVPRLRS